MIKDHAMQRGPQVWVPHSDGRLDISDACRFGTPIVISRRDVFPDNGDVRMPALLEEAHSYLQHYDPEQDYLCLIGSPVHLAVCSYVLGSLGMSPVRLLRYDRQEKCYYPLLIEDKELDDERCERVNA
jgi:hypothetical protein